MMTKLRTACLCVALSAPAFSLLAEPFNNWPTYASSPLENWPKAAEYDKLVDDLTWCHEAMKERCTAVSVSETGIEPATQGTRRPKEDIERFKDKLRDLIPKYVDHGLEATFTEMSEIPILRESDIVSNLSLPNDFFTQGVTPDRCLDATVPLLPGWDVGYGLPKVEDVIRDLKWTNRRRWDHSEFQVDGKGREGRGENTVWPEKARTDAIADYENSPWAESTYSGSYYYRAKREHFYDFIYGGDVAYFFWRGVRKRAKAKLDGIPHISGVSFEWDLYLEVEDRGNDFMDIDGLGFQNDRLHLHESGIGSEQTREIASSYIQALETDLTKSPIEADPVMPNIEKADPQMVERNTQDCAVKYVDWVLKWDFQFGD